MEWVRNNLHFDKPRQISFFETTIRCLGGLLAAYELSGEAVLLEKATDLGERLLKAFSSPSGLPYASISLSTGAHSMASWTGGNLLLAEVGAHAPPRHCRRLHRTRRCLVMLPRCSLAIQGVWKEMLLVAGGHRADGV